MKEMELETADKYELLVNISTWCKNGKERGAIT